jgi:hypothetical protein
VGQHISLGTVPLSGNTRGCLRARPGGFYREGNRSMGLKISFETTLDDFVVEKYAEK